jgi:hypothetical protein
MTSYVGQRQHVTRTWTNQYRMTDEHLNYERSLNSGDNYNINMGLYGKSCGGDDGQEDNVATPEVHQRGEDILPFQLKQQMYRDKIEEGHGWSF